MLIKNRTIIKNQWRLEQADTLDDCGGDDCGGDYLILPLKQWLKLRNASDSGKHIGVKLEADDEVESITADLHRIPLIALNFGSFNEGRGYSQAVQLRQQHHYTGELRALNAYRDNLPLMERCGIDAYELAEGEDITEALSAFDEITAYYQ